MSFPSVPAAGRLSSGGPNERLRRDGHSYAVPAKPGDKDTTQLQNTTDTDLWGLELPKAVNGALEPAVATLTWD